MTNTSKPISTIPANARGVEIIAHRGASFDAPENTVAAAKLAWEQNANAVEIDIHLTKDRRIVASHDDNTKRCAGRDRKVIEQTFAELRQLDAGAWKGRQWAGERIPSLEQVLATIPQGKRLVIEIKCGSEVVPILGRTLAESGRKAEQFVIIGFSYEIMREVKQQLPRFQAYWLVGFKRDETTGVWTPTAQEVIEKATAAGFDGVDLSHQGPVDAAFVNQIKAAGLGVYVYTVNDAEPAVRLAEAGVEGITTDRPAWLRDTLGRP